MTFCNCSFLIVSWLLEVSESKPTRQVDSQQLERFLQVPENAVNNRPDSELSLLPQSP